MFRLRCSYIVAIAILVLASVACGGAPAVTSAPPTTASGGGGSAQSTSAPTTSAPQATSAPSGGGGGTTSALNIGYSVWTGYGPLFIARDKGYFKEEGLDVTLTKVADPKERFAALAAKRLDGLVSTLDTMTLYWKAETPFKAILGLDDSTGGDGIISKPDIASVKDLKGKTVGVNVGSVSHFFLDYLLQQNGMSDADLKIVKMSQDDVPAAFASGRIDAGVTWEPNLSGAAKQGAKILVSSKETPGLIVDVLILRNDVLQARPDDGKKLVRAWNKAIEYWKANPDDADAIMQKGLGGYLKTPDDVKADLKGITLYDAARNKQFFSGTGQGTAIGTTKFAIDLWTKLGNLPTPVKAEDIVDASFIQ